MLTPHARHRVECDRVGVRTAARTPYGTEGTVEGAERAVKYDEKKTPQFTHHSAAGPSDRSDLSLEAVSKRVSNVQVAEGERHSR
jgi:hypothetical protein